MNIYVHQGLGHYIGSDAVVVAESPLQAVEMIRQLLDAAGLKNEAVTIQGLREYRPEAPGVILFNDGDY